MSHNSGSGEQPKLKSLQDIITSDSSILSFDYKLPPEFFEKVLECEVDLKEKFDPKIFFDLINYYSKAIEFYESISDPKFLIYNQALNFLFEQPEAKKFLEGKDLGKEFRKKEIMQRFKQCEKIVTEEKVKTYIEKRSNGDNIKKSIDNLYNRDIEKQKNSFKKKLEEKRTKYKDKYKNREKENLENNDINLQNKNEINENKENIIDNIKEDKIKENENKKDEKNEDEDFKIGGDEILNLGDSSGEEQDEISEIDFNIDDVMELVNIAKEENKQSKEKNEDKNKQQNEEKKESKDNKIIKEEKKPIIPQRKLLPKKSLKRTNKTRLFEKMMENFGNYFNGYYEYFTKNYVDLIIKEFEDNETEISKKVCESGVNYLNQIKDMEYLLENKDNEESYKKEIENIVKQSNEEREKNIEKMISDNDTEIKKINNKYIVNNTLLKEKFKLDTTKLLNSFIFK